LKLNWTVIDPTGKARIWSRNYLSLVAINTLFPLNAIEPPTLTI
jgi:hypothetical protein